MSSPGLVPQTVGKPTLKRNEGSQLFIDHNISVPYAAHLEEFSISSRVKSKKSHESFVASFRMMQKYAGLIMDASQIKTNG